MAKSMFQIIGIKPEPQNNLIRTDGFCVRDCKLDFVLETKIHTVEY